MTPSLAETTLTARLARRHSLGELMVSDGVLTPNQLTRALAHQSLCGAPLGDVLVELGFATEHQVLTVLSEQCRVPWIDLTRIEPAPALADLIPVALARRLYVLPIALEGARRQNLIVAIRAPARLDHIDLVRAVSKKVFVRAVIATDRSIAAAIDALYVRGEGTAPAPR